MILVNYKKFLIAAIIAFAIGALSVPTTHAQFRQGEFPARFLFNARPDNSDRDQVNSEQIKKSDEKVEKKEVEKAPVVEVAVEEKKEDPKKEVVPVKSEVKKIPEKKVEAKEKVETQVRAAFYDPEYTSTQVTEDYYAPIKLNPVVSKMLGGFGGLTGIAGMMLAVRRPRKLAMRLFSIIP